MQDKSDREEREWCITFIALAPFYLLLLLLMAGTMVKYLILVPWR